MKGENTMKAERKKYIGATINPHNQNLESVHRIVARALGVAGCSGCGRISKFNLEFVGDPPPDLAKDGVISFEQQGF
jgi:hypothetical protein